MKGKNIGLIMSKDFKLFRRKKGVISGLMSYPLIVAVLLPLVVLLVQSRNPENLSARITPLMDAFSYFFTIVASALPIALASYSIVGEKVEKSLEPLLTTPISDGELLIGKILAAFFPSIIVTDLSAIICVTLLDLITKNSFGYLYFPNSKMWLILFLLIPLASLLSIEFNVFISSKVSDIRASQQFGFVMILPMGAIYVMTEIHMFDLTPLNLFYISMVILGGIAILLILCVKTFHREEILTKWK